MMVECPSCNQTVADNAIFCPKCGARLADAAHKQDLDAPEPASATGDSSPGGGAATNATPPAAHPASGRFAPPGRDADDEEQLLWEGGFSGRAMLGSWSIAFGITLVAIAVAVIAGFQYRYQIALVVILIAWLVPLARLAYRKAADVARRLDRALIIAADTVAECNGLILGKPTDRSHAAEMLRQLAGREHRVLTDLCVWRAPDGSNDVRVAVTRLTMEQLSAATLEEYLDSDAWQGKAGAFGYQDRLGWVHIIEGSESNVVGLPMELVPEMLAEAGYRV